MRSGPPVPPVAVDNALEGLARLARRSLGAAGALVALADGDEAEVVAVAVDPPHCEGLLGTRFGWRVEPGQREEDDEIKLRPEPPGTSRVMALNNADGKITAFLIALGEIHPTSESAAALDDFRTAAEIHLALQRQIADRDADLDLVQKRYRGLVERIPAVTYVCDVSAISAHLYISPQIEAWTGYPAQRWVDSPEWWYEVIHPDDRDRVKAEVERTYETDEDFDMEYRIVSADGRVLYVWDRETILRDRDGQPLLGQGILVDTTDARRAEEELALSQARLRALVHSSPLALLSVEHDGTLSLIAGNAASALGLDAGKHVGTPYAEALAAFPELCARLQTAQLGTSAQFDVQIGDTALEITLEPVWQEQRVVSVTGVALDVTTRWRSEKQLARLAAHDPLTGLFNRAGLQQEALRLTSEVANPRLALLYVDLDNFKSVNDALGHAAGDRLLVAVARALHDGLPNGVTVARHGGDEFIVLAPVDADESRPGTATVEAVRRALSRPVVVDNRAFRIGASIGVAILPDHAADLSDLLRHADKALYDAKRGGRGSAEWYEPGGERDLVKEHRTHRLRQAIDNDQLDLHFQPIVDLATGLPLGFEALLRWEDPLLGPIAPREALALAERAGVGDRLDSWILGSACRQARRLLDLGIDAYISVNTTSRQLTAPEVVGEVRAELRKHGVPASALVLEVTEDTVVGDDVVIPALERLRDMGVRVSLDDFGAGYSALLPLHGLPADILKIDRSFVSAMGTTPGADALVSSFLHLAGQLGMVSIAEGVETADQRDLLRKAGCDGAQGYGIARPLSSEQVEQWIAHRQHPAASDADRNSADRVPQMSDARSAS